MWILESHSPEETLRLGRIVGQQVNLPLVVALLGDLGVGKTCLAKGVGEGLSVPEEIVSPTFILVQEYEGASSLLHADVYRLHAHELEAVGIEEQIEDWPGLALVEWADRFEDLLPHDHLRIEISDVGRNKRRIEFEARGVRSEQSLKSIRQEWERRNSGG